MNVCIIDNYISSVEVEKLTGRKISCHKIRNGQCITFERESVYRAHGTICAAILSETLSLDIKITAIAVADEKGEITLGAVCTALDWCCKNHISYISMSIGVERWDNLNILIAATRKAASLGIWIFCACANVPVFSFPSAFPWVIGVGYREEARGFFCYRDSVIGEDIITGRFESVILHKLFKERCIPPKKTNSMVVPYVLGKMIQFADCELPIWVEKKYSDEIERIPEELIRFPVITLVGETPELPRLPDYFQEKGYLAAMLTEQGNTDWIHATVNVKNSQKLHQTVFALCQADILFLRLNHELERVVPSDYTVDVRGKSVVEIYNEIVRYFNS